MEEAEGTEHSPQKAGEEWTVTDPSTGKVKNMKMYCCKVDACGRLFPCQKGMQHPHCPTKACKEAYKSQQAATGERRCLSFEPAQSGCRS